MSSSLIPEDTAGDRKKAWGVAGARIVSGDSRNCRTDPGNLEMPAQLTLWPEPFLSLPLLIFLELHTSLQTHKNTNSQDQTSESPCCSGKTVPLNPALLRPQCAQKPLAMPLCPTHTQNIIASHLPSLDCSLPPERGASLFFQSAIFLEMVGKKTLTICLGRLL